MKKNKEKLFFRGKHQRISLIFSFLTLLLMATLPLKADLTKGCVVNTAGSTVSIIDTEKQAVIATVDVLVNPWDVAITPDGKFAYVTIAGDPSGEPPIQCEVSVIDIEQATVTQNISVLAIPRAIAITPDGKFAYVLSSGTDAFLSIIDIQQGTVVKEIPLEDIDPLGNTIVFSPDGKLAYIGTATPGSSGPCRRSTLTIIDTQKQEIAGYFGDFVNIFSSLAITANGAFLWGVSLIPSGDGRSPCYIINLETKFILQFLLDNPTVTLAITPDGQYAYVGVISFFAEESFVYIMQASNGKLVKKISLGTSIFFPTIAFSPNGDFAYVCNGLSISGDVTKNQLFIIDTASQTLLPQKITVGEGPINLAFPSFKDISSFGGANPINTSPGGPNRNTTSPGRRSSRR